MQPNVIELNVDVANTGVTELQPFTRFEEQLNRTTYVGSGHSLANRDLLQLYRTTPTASGNFRGTAKSSVKFTQDVSVAGVDGTTSVIAPAIVDISFSFPVGMPEAAQLELRQRAASLLDLDAVMSDLNGRLMI